MEIATYIINAILAAALVAVGITLCWRNETNKAAVTAALSFGFLVLLLLNMSKFKHVKGFGFDAETWDEKQVEAAKLVDQLSSMTEALSRQIVLLSVRVGTFGAAFTNPELMDVYQQADKQLVAASIPKPRRDEILEPLRQRMILDYWWAARHLIDNAYVAQYDMLRGQGQIAKAAEEQNERARLEATPETLLTSGGLDQVIFTVRSSKLFTAPDDLIKNLTDLNEDMKYFIANGEMRRKIDLNTAYP